MNKRLLTLVYLCALSLLAIAQSAPLAKGKKQVNFGAGFGSGFPVYGGVDFAVHKDITVGPEVGFNLGGFDYLTLTGRGDYHWNSVIGIPSDWDFYTGLNLGVLIGFDGHDTGLDLSAQIGGRYYWNDKWAFNMEFGGGTMNVGGKVGVSMKL